MKVVLTTPGRFHTFALARELHAAGHLSAIVSGFPWAQVQRENVPRKLVKTFPFVTLIRFGLGRIGLAHERANLVLDDFRAMALDRYARRWARDADIYMALSGSGLRTGLSVKRRGGVYICDRGSTHILFQKRILEQEAARFGAPAPMFSAKKIRRELAEYEAADAITVPSEFVRRSFIAEGVSPDKVHKVPYGSNIDAFFPSGGPPKDSFEVLFVGGISLRKGVPDLFSAFELLRHPRKRLTIVGSPTSETPLITRLAPDGVRFVGHLSSANLKDIMSRSHVMVLPSVEEGLALVMGEALACGCPVVASENTGATDLFTDGEEGFILRARDADTFADRLQRLADDPNLQGRMARAARMRMTTLRGWGAYGDQMISLYKQILERKSTNSARAAERLSDETPCIT
ncbi:glycosyltransferase family 4 protein [Caulobacter sp. B11]|uniref:glycosyltransferase family 4 protein n=1 Tax=Caulobacter sp. B11 TaxID=2048899 RepID=UPI0013747453|nr:glycosyltransferase family 4 protein [Caulobacter sp. B11]